MGGRYIRREAVNMGGWSMRIVPKTVTCFFSLLYLLSSSKRLCASQLLRSVAIPCLPIAKNM